MGWSRGIEVVSATSLAIGWLVAPVEAQCPVDKLLASDAQPDAHFGESISLFRERLLVGSPEHGKSIVPSNFGAGAAYLFERGPAGWTETAKLVPSDLGTGFLAVDTYGNSVALGETTALIGAPCPVCCPDCFGGAAYVFEETPTGWMEVAKLTSSSDGDDRFGTAVALHGDTAVVSSPYGDLCGSGGISGCGEAYVFERTSSGWNQTGVLIASDPVGQGRFGWSLAIWQDVIVVGAVRHDGHAPASGAAYVFERRGAGWEQTAKLTGREGPSGDPYGLDWDDSFGSSVAVWGDRVAVGAVNDDTLSLSSGAVYVYERGATGWQPTEKLITGNPALDPLTALFGDSVDLFEDRLVVGSPGIHSASVEGGAVFLFERNESGWSQIDMLVAPDMTSGDGFGTAVSMNGRNLFVGASGDDDVEARAGSVHAWSLVGADCPALFGAPEVLTVSTDSTKQELLLAAGPEQAARPYLVLGSAHGTSPGTPGPATLPLNVDGYLLFTLGYPNTLIEHSAGLLDAEGRASATVAFPPDLARELVGQELHHAFVVLEVPGTGAPTFTSNAASLVIGL